MLVLSRKKTESICINDNIVVRVLSIRGNRVEIGIDAPKETPVHRRELFERIRWLDVATTVAGKTAGKSE